MLTQGPDSGKCGGRGEGIIILPGAQYDFGTICTKGWHPVWLVVVAFICADLSLKDDDDGEEEEISPQKPKLRI